MNSYLFLLGATPQLSLLELRTLFPDIEDLGLGVARLSTGEPLSRLGYEPQQLVDFLGGTIKIAQSITEVSNLGSKRIAEILEKLAGQKKITFGLSVYGSGEHLPRSFLSEIKQELELLGISSRFIEARDTQALSSVVVAKEHVLDLVLIKTAAGWLIGQTIAVQSFGEWGKRDRERPFSDPRRGMLPPKVARMVVNIARSTDLKTLFADRILVDPFCGMGTILAEALLTGWNVIGMDISVIVVGQAQKNIAWLDSNYPYVKKQQKDFFVSDAVHVSQKIAPLSVDAIVTEPFMGTTRIADAQVRAGISLEKVRNVIKGLEKLYMGCLKDWHKILKNDGRVIIALPEYKLQGRKFSVKRVVDSCENLGYTMLAGPVEYGRPQAIVKREFYIFQKKDS